MRLFFIAVILLLLVTDVAGCTAEERGSLVIYTALFEDHAIKVAEAFQKETGIKVSYVRLSSGQILARIRSERIHPGADIWLGGPADTFVQAETEGLLEPYISPNANAIDPVYKDHDGHWTGIYVGSIAFVSNQKWLQEVGLPPPQSWYDLIKPQYKGMVSMADPRSSGTAYTTFATLVQLFGEEEAFSYLKKLHGQIGEYKTSGNVTGRNVGMGEVGTAIMFSHDGIKYYKEGFRDLVITFPNEGTGYEIGAIAIVKGTSNLSEARRFVDWALTRQAQELGKQVGSYQLLTNKNAVPPEEAIPLASLNVIPYDHVWAGENRERLLSRWEKEVLNQ
jgi:ABC-type Fe3+ transport system, periplasmic component